MNYEDLLDLNTFFVMIKFYDQTLYRLHLCLIIPLLFFSICHNNGFF